MAGEINISDELHHFVKDCISNHYAMKIILFFAHHPYARFNELAIIQALTQDGGGRLIQHTLKGLVSMGIIKTWMDGEAALFSLIENKRSLALELAKLDVHQQQRLLWPNSTKNESTSPSIWQRQCKGWQPLPV